MIKIVKATDADFDAVMRMRMEALKVLNGLSEATEFDRTFVDHTAQYFRSSDQTTVLAVDREVIGCATICYIKMMPTFDHPNGKRAHIMNVYTRASYRRQGAASQMMEALIKEAKRNGVTELYLDATEYGRPLYEKCGFAKTQDGMVLNLKQR